MNARLAGGGFEMRDGIVRCLSAHRASALAPFLAQYRRVRERDGYRQLDPTYYRGLPWTADDDPERRVWAIRQQSFVRFRSMLRTRFTEHAPAVLDLGAGSGWLSYRLTREGFEAVAVDLLDDDCDGLGAARHFDCGFARVQADFDELPFAARQFDAVVFNGSLHYAPDPPATLARVAALLKPGGVLAALDSPMFDSREAGLAMCARRRAHFRRAYGVADPVEPGLGFLLFGPLADAARALERDALFFESRGGLVWEAGRALGFLRHGIRPARFGVWWAA